MNLKKGQGLFFRDEGKLPPKFRELLSKIGDEKITSMTLFRKPISVEKFLNFISGGIYQKIIKQAGYDSLFHLGLVINNKYILDKQEVLTLKAGNIPTEAEKINISNIPEVNISKLIENTQKLMGSKFSGYNAKTNNCQDFILSVLKSNRLDSVERTGFIKQNSEEVFNKLPKYVEVLTDFVTDAAAVIDRQIQGEGASKNKYPILLF